MTKQSLLSIISAAAIAVWMPVITIAAVIITAMSSADAKPSVRDATASIILVVDDGFGPSLFGVADDQDLTARTVVDALRTLSRRKWQSNTPISFVSTVTATEPMSTTLARIGEIDGHEFTATFAAKETCADFTDAFKRVEYQLRRDRTDEVYLIVISPLYDVDHSHCKILDDEDVQETHFVELPQQPKEDLALRSIASNPSVRSISFIGWRPEQEQPFYDFMHGGENPPTAQIGFESIQSIAQEIRKWR